MTWLVGWTFWKGKGYSGMMTRKYCVVLWTAVGGRGGGGGGE